MTTETEKFQVHRFRQFAALHGSGSTEYISAETARRLAGLLLACAADIEARDFSASEFRSADTSEAPAPEFETMNVLTLSTAHIQQGTTRWIENEDMALFSSDYGYLLYADYSADEGEETEWPADLKAVCDFARSHGFTHIRLDSDGRTVDGLPKFDW